MLAERYEVVRRIARGGMSDILEARGKDGQRYAIKLLREELSDDEEIIARFHREARAAAALRSPHTVRVLDFGISERNMPFIVMELLQGNDLEHEIRMRGALPIDEAATYLSQACKAMIEAHAAGIIHRDLKPPNLFLAEEASERRLKVLDFGISKVPSAAHDRDHEPLTLTEARFGSPLYMSPEAFRSTKSADARSDIWSLGVIFYEIITGMPPFMAENPVALGVEVCKSEPILPSQRRPGLPRTADVVAARALKKDPSERYQSMAELLAALEVLLPRPSGTMTLMRIDRPGDVDARPDADIDTDDARTVRRDLNLADLVMMTAAPAAGLPPPPGEAPYAEESSDGPTVVLPINKVHGNVRARVKERKKKVADHLWSGPRSEPAPASLPSIEIGPLVELEPEPEPTDPDPTPVSKPPAKRAISDAPPVLPRASDSPAAPSETAGAISESDLPEILAFIHALPTTAIHESSRSSLPSSLPREGEVLTVPPRSALRRAIWLAPLAAVMIALGGWLIGRGPPDKPPTDATIGTAGETAALEIATTSEMTASAQTAEPVLEPPASVSDAPSAEPTPSASEQPTALPSETASAKSAPPPSSKPPAKPPSKPQKPPTKPPKSTRYDPTGL